MQVELMQGDCPQLISNVMTGSVDLVLTDPPYGTIKGADLDGWGKKTTEWDNALQPAELFSLIDRVLRPSGKAVIFSQEPYTSKLITSAIPSISFCYRAIWYKNVQANALSSKKAMVGRFEDILIFSKIHPKHDFAGAHPLRQYSEKCFRYIGQTKKEIIQAVGQSADHFFRFDSTQFALCTEEAYRKLIEHFGISEMVGFISYENLQSIDAEYRRALIQKMNSQFPSVFNLWQGAGSKSNVLEYAKESDRYHPTQKPVLLLEDLIKTYSNPGNIVLDCCMGGGSTGVACVNTGRQFIGMELDPGYFEIAKTRITKHLKEREAL